MSDNPKENSLFGAAFQMIKPLAKRVIYNAVIPGPQTRWLYAGLFQADFFSRELYEWARRSLVATPAFLSQCASYGQDIAIERLPYMTGPAEIHLGSQIRFAGQVNILVGGRRPRLSLGNGVFIGHATTFAVANNVELHDYVGVGENCYITDTEGHSHYAPNRPIWEVPASEDDIAPTIIEENVQISNDCKILKGVRIGARAVIGAGSVVRSDIPPDAVVMGNPARVVKRMNPDEAKK